MEVIINLTVKIFLLLLVGFAGCRWKLINENMKKSLSDLLVNVVLPISIIGSSQQEFSVQHAGGLMQALLCSLVYYVAAVAICIALGRLFRLPKDKNTIFVILSVFANVGFLGFSIMREVLGSIGVLYAVPYNLAYELLFFSYGMYLLGGGGRLNFKSLFGNAVVWFSVSAMILYLLPFRFPAVLTDAMNCIGDTMLPISMIIIGVEIGNMKFREIWTDRTTYLVSLLRLAVFPAAALLLLRLLPVDGEVAAAIIILTALPAGSLGVIMAQKYDKCPGFAAAAVVQNMLFMIVSLPVFVYLAQTLFLTSCYDI
ncbi:MAG: AEC family transporter [Roseburia sp.]